MACFHTADWADRPLAAQFYSLWTVSLHIWTTGFLTFSHILTMVGRSTKRQNLNFDNCGKRVAEERMLLTRRLLVGVMPR